MAVEVDDHSVDLGTRNRATEVDPRTVVVGNRRGSGLGEGWCGVYCSAHRSILPPPDPSHLVQSGARPILEALAFAEQPNAHLRDAHIGPSRPAGALRMAPVMRKLHFYVRLSNPHHLCDAFILLDDLVNWISLL